MKKNTTTTTNATVDTITKKALEAQTAQTDKPKTDSTDKPKTEDKPKPKTDKKEDKPKKALKDETVNADAVTDKEAKKRIDNVKTELNKALRMTVPANDKDKPKKREDRKNVYINIDYKKAKVTIKLDNVLLARINVRKNDYYLRTYKNKAEHIAKNQTLEACTKAIEKLLA